MRRQTWRVKGSSFDASTDRKTSLLRDRTARRAVTRAYRIWVSDAAHHCVQLRNDLLFTMSDNLHRAIDEINAIQIQMHGRVSGPTGPSSLKLRRAAFAIRRLASRSRGAAKAGGARRDRTDDLLLAKQALSQLSYGPPDFAPSELRRASRPRKPARQSKPRSGEDWWAWEDSNFRPHAYQARALTN